MKVRTEIINAIAVEHFASDWSEGTKRMDDIPDTPIGYLTGLCPVAYDLKEFGIYDLTEQELEDVEGEIHSAYAALRERAVDGAAAAVDAVVRQIVADARGEAKGEAKGEAE